MIQGHKICIHILEVFVFRPIIHLVCGKIKDSLFFNRYQPPSLEKDHAFLILYVLDQVTFFVC